MSFLPDGHTEINLHYTKISVASIISDKRAKYKKTDFVHDWSEYMMVSSN